MEKPKINVTKVLEDTTSRVEIFIWENKYKESKSRDTTFKEITRRTACYSRIVTYNFKES